MKTVRKIFVGTLYVNESEFELCCNIINAQKDVDVHHEIISGLPEHEAHNKLWQTWNRAKSKHDLFVKIDADTVLNDAHSLARIARLFEADNEVTGVQLPLLDYYTNGPVMGLNCFSPEVIFTASEDPLFCDRVDSGHKKVLRGPELDSLYPIARHGVDPSPVQAFHFGFHRGLKKQKQIARDLARAYLDEGGIGRMYALAGFEKVGIFSKPLNYFDKKFQKMFQSCVSNRNLVCHTQKFANRLLK